MSSSQRGDEGRPICRFSSAVSSTLTEVRTQYPSIHRISLTSCSKASMLLYTTFLTQEWHLTAGFSRRCSGAPGKTDSAFTKANFLASASFLLPDVDWWAAFSIVQYSF